MPTYQDDPSRTPREERRLPHSGIPDDPVLHTREFRPIESYRRHPWLLAGVLVCGLVAAYAVGVRKAGGGRYESEAQVYVSPAISPIAADERLLDYSYDNLVNQYMALAARPDIVAKAHGALGPLNAAWSDPGALSGAVAVRRVPSTYQIGIAVHGPRPEGVREAADSLARAFTETVLAEQQGNRGALIAALRAEQNRLQSELTSRLGRKVTLAQDAGGSPGVNSPEREALNRTETELAQTRRLRIETESQLRVLDSALARQDPGSIRGIVDEQVAADPSLVALKTNLSQRRAQIQQQILGMAEKNPLRQAAEAELADIQNQLRKAADDVTQQSAARLRQRLSATLERTRLTEEELIARAVDQARLARDASGKMLAASEMAPDIERLRGQLSIVEARIRQVGVEAGALPSLRLFSPAAPPFETGGSAGRKLLLRLMLGAALLAFAAPLALDAFDPRILGPRDVERALGFPPAGLLLERSSTTAGFERLQVQRLARTLESGIRDGRVRSILFTSVRPGGGATTLVELLRAEMASSGLRPFVLDAEAAAQSRRAQQILTPVTAPAIPLVTVEGPAARLGPGGETPAAGSSALVVRGSAAPAVRESGSLARPLAAASSPAPVPPEVLLIDAPPLTLSAEAEHLARLSDLTVVVVEARKVLTADLRRVVRRLEAMRVPEIAAALNRVDPARSDLDLHRDFQAYLKRIRRHAEMGRQP